MTLSVAARSRWRLCRRSQRACPLSPPARDPSSIASASSTSIRGSSLSQPSSHYAAIMPQLDDSFLALPLQALSDAALSKAKDVGCSYAEVRVERIRAGVPQLS